jgi:hypothetical protein
MDSYVFLNDGETFSPIKGALIVEHDTESTEVGAVYGYCIETMLSLLTFEQLQLCTVEPPQSVYDEIETWED